MKLVILDRDGTINHDSDDYIKSPEEWRPIEGSLEAIARLNQAGYHVVVATNQSGVSRGLFEMAALNAINDKMHRALGQVGDTRNDNSPCVLWDGRIASLWLQRPGGASTHEIKVTDPMGRSPVMVQTDVDVMDVGISCSR